MALIRDSIIFVGNVMWLIMMAMNFYWDYYYYGSLWYPWMYGTLEILPFVIILFIVFWIGKLAFGTQGGIIIMYLMMINISWTFTFTKLSLYRPIMNSYYFAMYIKQDAALCEHLKDAIDVERGIRDPERLAEISPHIYFESFKAQYRIDVTGPEIDDTNLFKDLKECEDWCLTHPVTSEPPLIAEYKATSLSPIAATKDQKDNMGRSILTIETDSSNGKRRSLVYQVQPDHYVQVTPGWVTGINSYSPCYKYLIGAKVGDSFTFTYDGLPSDHVVVTDISNSIKEFSLKHPEWKDRGNEYSMDLPSE